MVSGDPIGVRRSEVPIGDAVSDGRERASSPGGGSGTPSGVCADHISLLTRSENKRLSPDCGIRPAASCVMTHRDMSLTFELMAPAGPELSISVYGIACKCPSTLECGVATLSPARNSLTLVCVDCIPSGPKIRCFTKSSQEDPVTAAATWPAASNH